MKIVVQKAMVPILVIALLLTAVPLPALAANPLLPLDNFTPDVEARVYTNSEGETRLYLYGSNDEYPPTGWCSWQYRVYSAPLDDLDNWTDHGVSFASRKGEGYIWEGEDADGISWSNARLYAPDVIEFEGRYWLASCLSTGGLGMSVSDTPEGPFSPAAQIVYDDDKSSLGSIDPALYAEDGVLYLLWGQTTAFSGGEGLVGVILEQDENGLYSIARRDSKSYLFGDATNPDKGFGFYEGPSIRKINDKYYVLYPSSKGVGQHMMSYATADHPLGPYTFGGNILDSEGIDREKGNNHGSFCEVNGQWYIFYHRGYNGNTSRKVCVEPITINPDGSIDPVQMTNHGFGGPPSPYEPVEAATLTHVFLPGSGFARTAHLDRFGPDLHPLVNITDNSCIEYRDFDFGEGGALLVFQAEMLAKDGGTMELVLDDPKGEAIGVLDIPAVAFGEWTTLSTGTQGITGVHTLYLRFAANHGGEIAQLARFHFEQPESIFADSFDAGLGKWKNLRNAAIQDEKLVVRDNQTMAARNNTPWQDYTLYAEVAILEGQAGVAFRKTEDGTHYAVILSESGVELVKSVGGVQTTMAQAPQSYALQTPYKLSVECSGGNLLVRVDGAQVLRATDYSLAAGTIGFVQPAGTAGRFDDVVVVPAGRAGSDAILVNGIVIPGFSFDRTSYRLKAKVDDPTPVVTATSGPDTAVSVQQADGVPGQAVVTFSGNGAERSYTIHFVTDLWGETDHFDQPEPVASWTVLNPNRDPGAWSYTAGEGLRLTSTRGDFPNTIDNMYLQQLEGDWQVETKLTVHTSTEYSQAGLTLYQDSANYTKFVIMYGNTVELLGTDIKIKQAGVQLTDGNIWLRIRKTGSRYVFSYSTNGVDYVELGAGNLNVETIHAGLVAFAPISGGSIDATFRHFEVENYFLRDDLFEEDRIGDFWDIRNPSPSNVSYDPGAGLTVTTEYGDFGNTANPPKNMYLQSTSGDWETEIKATVTSKSGYAQFGLVVYENDSSFIKFVHMADNNFEINTSGGEKTQEHLNVPLGTPLWMSIRKVGDTYSFHYSTDGESYTKLGERTMSMQAVNTGFAAVSSTASNSSMTVTFHHFKSSLNEWYLDPLVEVTGINLAPDSIAMALGEVSSTLVSVTPDNATIPDITWSITSGDDVASLLSAGSSRMAVIEATGTGTATLRATSTQNPAIHADCEIVVGPNKNALQRLVSECESYRPGDADEALVEAFHQALSHAGEALAAADDQSEVDDAADRLQVAYYALLGVDDSVDIAVAEVAHEGHTNKNRLNLTLGMSRPDQIDAVLLLHNGAIVERWDYDDLVVGVTADDDDQDAADDDDDDDLPARARAEGYTLGISLAGRRDGLYRIVAKLDQGGGTYSFTLDKTPPVLTHDGRGIVTIVEDNMAALWDNGEEIAGFAGDRYAVDLSTDHEIVAYDKAGNSARILVERQTASAGSSGGSGRSRNGGSNQTPPATTALAGGLAPAALEAALNSAITQAGEGGQAQVRLRNITRLDEAAAKRLRELCAQTGNDVTIHFDTVVGTVVVRRLSLHYTQLDTGMELGFDAAAEAATDAIFQAHFRNGLFSVCLNEAVTTAGRVAAKVPEGVDPQNLVIYRYERSSNQYRRLPAAYRVDRNGYVHFDVEQGGTYLLSDGTLEPIADA